MRKQSWPIVETESHWNNVKILTFFIEKSRGLRLLHLIAIDWMWYDYLWEYVRRCENKHSDTIFYMWLSVEFCLITIFCRFVFLFFLKSLLLEQMPTNKTAQKQIHCSDLFKRLHGACSIVYVVDVRLISHQHLHVILIYVANIRLPWKWWMSRFESVKRAVEKKKQQHRAHVS